MNRPVHTAASEQRLICGVDDGINFQLRDIGLNDSDTSSAQS